MRNGLHFVRKEKKCLFVTLKFINLNMINQKEVKA